MTKTRDELIDELMEAIIAQEYDLNDDDILPTLVTNRKVTFDLPKDLIEKSKKGVILDADLYLH